jgi:hypothetical protein
MSNEEFVQTGADIICTSSCSCFRPHRTITLSFNIVVDGEVEGPKLPFINGKQTVYERRGQALLCIQSYCIPCTVISRKDLAHFAV